MRTGAHGCTSINDALGDLLLADFSDIPGQAHFQGHLRLSRRQPGDHRRAPGDGTAVTVVARGAAGSSALLIACTWLAVRIALLFR